MRVIRLAVLGLTATALGASAMGEQLPGTLNFENQTASRINQTVGEDAGENVKEVEAGDIDNDGDLDVAIAAAGGVFGNRKNKLYRNDDGVFNEISGAPVIPGFTELDLSRHVFIRDYDADGWKDIVVVNDDLGGGGHVKFYRSLHPSGFEPWTQQWFVEEGLERGLDFQASCGGVSVDVDGDGDYDVWSGNYPGPSQDSLFLNDGTGNFLPYLPVITTHVPVDGDYTIDVGAGDMNGDGKIDLLISNHSPNYIYYNNLLDQGEDGDGDYRYGPSGTGGKQNLGTSGADGAMEPGDFNNDGMMDFYWTNKVGAAGDRILVNTGNDANGKATFQEVLPPPYATFGNGNKISVADLNQDGRIDVVVGVISGRPAVLRNTSVNGVVSFVDWTPAPAFPSGSTHRADFAGLFDTNGDGDVDIFLGGRHNDHLFENVPATELDEADLGSGSGGGLGSIWNASPRAIVGRAASGEADLYTVDSIGTNSLISVVLNGPDDYRLEVLNASDVVQATSDRGGAGIEEALQQQITVFGDYKIRVTVLGCGATAGDVDGNCTVDVTDLVQVISAWGENPGHPADFDGNGVVDVSDLISTISAWGPIVNDYVLEVLARSG